MALNPMASSTLNLRTAPAQRYLPQIEYDFNDNDNLINGTVFDPSPDGQYVWKVDTSSLATVTTLSYRNHLECVTPDDLTAPMYPYVFWGDLPASTPPYSIQMFND